MEVLDLRDYLIELRAKKGLTQADVAKKIGISEPYYQMIESGKRQRNMDITLAAKLSDVFSVPMDQLVQEEAKLAKTTMYKA